jgi:nicotinamide-nucleotide amidase
MDYIMKNLKEEIGIFDSIKVLNKNDNDFFIQLEDCIKKFNQTIILTHSKNFNFVNKIIATLNEDNLELKDDMLIPSKTVLYSKNSYLMQLDEKTINVLSVEENKKLPEIFINDSLNTKNFTIIDIDIDSVGLLLAPICETYDIKIETTAIIDGWINIQAVALKYGNLENFIKAVKSLFIGKFIEKQDIVEHIIQKLEENQQKLTTAESCTGGLISSMITKVAGASNVYDGGIVSYANEIKESWLGVDKSILENYGAVSEPCVLNMLEGALQASKAQFALATSGIAGPGGGSEEKPVGTVFVGVKEEGKEAVVQRLLLKGDRQYIQAQSAFYAFKMLLQINKKLFF